MISTLLDRIEDIVFGIRPIIIGVFVVITIFMGFGLTNLHVDAGYHVVGMKAGGWFVEEVEGVARGALGKLT